MPTDTNTPTSTVPIDPTATTPAAQPPSDPATSQSSAAGAKIMPDDFTKRRFQILAEVGEAIAEMSNGRGFETNLYLAEQGINNFLEEMDKLDLAPEVIQGMHNLMSTLKQLIKDQMQIRSKIVQQNF